MVTRCNSRRLAGVYDSAKPFSDSAGGSICSATRIMRMRPPWFAIRAVAIAIAVCVATAFAGSAIVGAIMRRGPRSQLGRIARGIKDMTPDIQRRDKEVEELTRP
jgi:hypothetical protein